MIVAQHGAEPRKGVLAASAKGGEGFLALVRERPQGHRLQRPGAVEGIGDRLGFAQIVLGGEEGESPFFELGLGLPEREEYGGEVAGVIFLEGIGVILLNPDGGFQYAPRRGSLEEQGRDG